MNLAEIFRKAATYHKMNLGACAAIEWAMGKDYEDDLDWDYSRPHIFFNNLFKPERRTTGLTAAAYWFSFDNGFSYDGKEESKIKANNDRRLALLLAAEVARSEGL